MFSTDKLPRNNRVLYLGLIVTKPVFGVSDNWRRGSNQSPQLQGLARKLKLRLWHVWIWYFLKREKQRRWSDCADSQAGLRLCCSQITEDRFSHDEAHLITIKRYDRENVEGDISSKHTKNTFLINKVFFDMIQLLYVQWLFSTQRVNKNL